MMNDLIAHFPQQLKTALEIGNGADFKHKYDLASIQNVVITGLGGSGIGGSIVADFVKDKLSVPIIVNKGYSLPNFVNEKTLLIVSSYSGNTEETLMAMQQGIEAKAQIVCVTSGGEVAEIAVEKNFDILMMPGGNPPRASLGYSLTQVLFALKKVGLFNYDFISDLEGAIALLIKDGEEISDKAKEVAEKVFGKIPVIYAADNYEGLAIRVRQQLNENSKILAWHGVVPEMNHNELVGWKDRADDKVVIFLRTKEDLDRIQSRIELNKEIIQQYTSNIIELYAEGEGYLGKLFYFIHLTDWLSWHLSVLRGVDATEVKVIDFLKGELAKQ